MDQADGALEVPIRRDILVVGTGRAIIRKAQPMPVAKMLVQQPLIGAVEADTSIGERLQSIVVLHVGPENHHPAIEAIGPADIRGSGEVHVQREKLVGRSNGHDVTIEEHNPAVLRLAPELDLGKGRDQVWAVHEPEVCGRTVCSRVNGNELIVYRLGCQPECIAGGDRGR